MSVRFEVGGFVRETSDVMPTLRRVAALALILIAPLAAPRAAPQEHIGQYAQADIIRGAQLYTAQCSVCHGLTGNGVGTVDLRRGTFRTAVSDNDLKRVIQSGVPASGMPPFKLDEPELTALLAFIRAGMDVNAPAAAIAVGDAANGQRIFAGKGDCLSCHRVDGRGGRSGPDLSDIASARTPASLHGSLLDPTSVMQPLNRPVRLVTRDGQTIIGRRLNEDTYTVQIATDDGRLASFDKAGLRELQVQTTSPMPSYRDRLTAAELADLFAYLLTLRDPNAPRNPFGRGAAPAPGGRGRGQR
jgi:cytochrome c oxidase cbb3-type subunit III